MQYLARRSGVFAKAAVDTNDNEPVISHVVSQLNAICRNASFDFALSVGECVVKNLYHGDLSRFRSRARSKERTLRAIATHPDLQMSPGALYRSIAAYELCERLGTPAWQHVSLSHMRLVLPLKPNDQARLLKQAEGDRWPVQRLDEEVAALMRAEGVERRRGGRRRSSRLGQAIRTLDQATEQLRRVLESGDGGSAEVSTESTRAAVASLQRAADMCRRLQNRLERTLRGAGSSPPSPPPSSEGANALITRIALVTPANALSRTFTVELAARTDLTTDIVRKFLRVSRRGQELLGDALELLGVPGLYMSPRLREGLDELRWLARHSRDLLHDLRSFLAGRDHPLSIDGFAAEVDGARVTIE